MAHTSTMNSSSPEPWTNSSSDDDYIWDPSTPLYCYTVNENNIKYYLIPIYQIIGPVLVILCSISVIGNSVILLTVFFMRKKHLTPTLMFSLSLAGADAMAALAMGIGFMVNNILPFNFDYSIAYDDCVVLIVEAFRLGAMVCSALHFVVLAVNHWMGITKPLHYASRMTRRTAVLCIITMWILPVMVFFAYFSLVPEQGFQSESCGNVNFTQQFLFRGFVSAMFFWPLALMSMVYLHVFFVIGQHQKKRHSLDAACHSDEKRRMQSNTKALITTLIILLTYLIGWLPAVINYVIVCADCVVPLSISLCIRLPVNIVTNLLIVLKFLIDPIIYTARIQEVRTVIKYFGAKCGCQTSGGNDPTSVFNRFDSSQTGSIMTSLRYSTYRQRKESDCSYKSSPAALTRLGTTRKGHLLSVDANGCSRRMSTDSNGSTRRSDVQPMKMAPVFPAHSPLIEVSESGLVTPDSPAKDANCNGT